MNLTTDKLLRKEQPIARGVLDYFGNALAEVARVSFIGNKQHNPGEEMHWAKGKSTDHADCIARHLIERGTFDDDGLRHTAKVAWRALALLQSELETAGTVPVTPSLKEMETEKVNGVPIFAHDGPPQPHITSPYVGLYQPAHDPEVEAAVKVVEATGRFVCGCAIYETCAKCWGEREPESRRDAWNKDRNALYALLCDPTVITQILGGMTCHENPQNGMRKFVYVAGPMRNLPAFNFPAFDTARELLYGKGYNVISPADIDRVAKDENSDNQQAFAYRDFYSLYFIAHQPEGCRFIAMLPGWEKSTGAAAEFFLSRWLGITVLDAKTGYTLDFSSVDVFDLVLSIRRFLEGQK